MAIRVAIRALERFASDFGASRAEKPATAPRGKKSGYHRLRPRRDECGYYLAKQNFSVTIFEARTNRRPIAICDTGISACRKKCS